MVEGLFHGEQKADPASCFKFMIPGALCKHFESIKTTRSSMVVMQGCCLSEGSAGVVANCKISCLFKKFF